MATAEEYENDPLIAEAMDRGFLSLKSEKVYYHLHQDRSYLLSDPEELVRAHVVSYLIIVKSYPPIRIRTEVKVSRRTPNDWADIVVYEDDDCKKPYLVVETKAPHGSDAFKKQAIEQLFGNANSLRCPWALFDDGESSIFFDVMNYPAEERADNQRGSKENIPEQYGDIPSFRLIAGDCTSDIRPASAKELETKVKRAHSLIWAGGKRDPLTAFGEWCKLMFAKMEDERMTRSGEPRRFQVGSNESVTKVASRVHRLFYEACGRDYSVFAGDEEIALPDDKVVEVVKVLQDISFMDTSVDVIGRAFEFFFGSVFRGELGQYFTMRPLARFAVAMLDLSNKDHVIDITCGSGGFLLEALLQVWKRIERDYAGRDDLIAQNKAEFAQQYVFGIEIHRTLAQICRINLLIHHDGNCNIEGDRSCLDSEFSNARLAGGHKFEAVIGNPPFGDSVKAGDKDQLGKNSFDSFDLARNCSEIASEHIVIEQAVRMLEDGGQFALVLPDGVFNNQSSSCVRVRRFLASQGRIKAVVSLPDYAFRTSGAQNKTSILLFEKFNQEDRLLYERAYTEAGGDLSQVLSSRQSEDVAMVAGLRALGYPVFFAEADWIGYTTTGKLGAQNDLYCELDSGNLDCDQAGTILGEYRRFTSNPGSYRPQLDCCGMMACHVMWQAHASHRIDAKYHLFKMQEKHQVLRDGWVSRPLGEIMTRREERVRPEQQPDQSVVVITLSQTGVLSHREAGKGNNPPEWLGMYFEDSPSSWYAVHEKDVVYSSIDLWKGCIGVVPEEFDGALVTKEYPVYRLTGEGVDHDFLAALLRSEYYQKAFKAITTGHSNRRRTQKDDFESLEIAYPEDIEVQRAMVKDIVAAKERLNASQVEVRNAEADFNKSLV